MRRWLQGARQRSHKLKSSKGTENRSKFLKLGEREVERCAWLVVVASIKEN